MNSLSPPTSGGRAKRPIWLKLTLLVLLFAITPASIIAFTLISSNAKALKLASREHRLGIVRSVAAQADAQLERVDQELQRIASVLADPMVDDGVKISVAKVIYSRNADLKQVAIYDANASLIDTLHLPGDSSPSRATLPKPWLSAPGLLVAWLPTKKEGVFVAPILPKGQKAPTGYVMAQVSLEPLFEMVKQWHKDHQTQEESLVLIDDRLLALVRQGKVRMPEPEVLQEFGVSLQTGKSIGRSGDVKGEDGSTLLLTVLPMRHAPWAVVAFEPEQSAYKTLRDLQVLVLVVLMAACVASFLLSLVLSRRLTAPLERLVAFSQRLGQRDFTAPFEPSHTKDEVEVLGHALFGAARDLAQSEETIRREEAIRRDLGRYLPEELVDRVVEREQPMGLGGERREITVLFADVVGFTKLCEQQDPEVVVGILNELFTIVTEIIFRHAGVVDKFMGDCVMAFWGAPQENEDHAMAALAAASEVMSWLEFGNDHWRDEYGLEVELAVGVHTGEAIVGNVGSDVRMEYTAIGDTVNMAARFESVARPGQVVMSSATVDKVGVAYEIYPIGSKRFAGREDALELFELRY